MRADKRLLLKFPPIL